jgi:PadR family transcriptional regulator PadR
VLVQIDALSYCVTHYSEVVDSGRALRELRRGTVEYCVLALLAREPMYGFELVRALDAAGGLVTSLGTIYPLLARLRSDGLVSVTTSASASGPARRYYHLTEAGRWELNAFVADWTRFRDAVDALLVPPPGPAERGESQP